MAVQRSPNERQSFSFVFSHLVLDIIGNGQVALSNFGKDPISLLKSIWNRVWYWEISFLPLWGILCQALFYFFMILLTTPLVLSISLLPGNFLLLLVFSFPFQSVTVQYLHTSNSIFMVLCTAFVRLCRSLQKFSFPRNYIHNACEPTQNADIFFGTTRTTEVKKAILLDIIYTSWIMRTLLMGCILYCGVIENNQIVIIITNL